MPGFRTGIFDIETTNLNANIGRLISISLLRGNGDIESITIADFKRYKRNPADDKMIIGDVVKLLKDEDILVGYYSKQPRFDLPFLVSRMIHHGIELPVGLLYRKHVDLYPYAKKWLPLTRRSLRIVSRFFKCATDKTDINWDNWAEAIAGQREAVDYIQKHNEHDVIVTGEVLEPMKPFIRVIN